MKCNSNKLNQGKQYKFLKPYIFCANKSCPEEPSFKFMEKKSIGLPSSGSLMITLAGEAIRSICKGPNLSQTILQTESSILSSSEPSSLVLLSALFKAVETYSNFQVKPKPNCCNHQNNSLHTSFCELQISSRSPILIYIEKNHTIYHANNHCTSQQIIMFIS